MGGDGKTDVKKGTHATYRDKSFFLIMTLMKHFYTTSFLCMYFLNYA